MAELTKSQQEIKDLLDDFVNNGGDINSLTNGHPLYHKVKNLVIRGLNLEQKFKLLGHERTPKMSAKNTSKTRLKLAIDKWIDDGHTLDEILKNDISVKTLPFYEILNTFRRSPENKHLKTFGDVIRDLGYTYPETYYRYQKINDLNKYKDANGFVDSYRKDKVLNNYIDNCAQNLNIPVFAVVCLVGNFKLKKMAVHGDLVAETKNSLLNYIEANGSLTSLKHKDPQTYEKLVGLSKYLIQDSGTKLTTADVLDLLEVPRDGTRYGKTATIEPLNESEINAEIVKIAKENNKKVTPALLGTKLYNKLVRLSCQKGIPVPTHVQSLGISYRGAINHERLSKFFVETYKPLNDAIKIRDELLKEKEGELKNLPKELAFEIYLDCCLSAYHTAIKEEESESQEQAQRTIYKN